MAERPRIDLDGVALGDARDDSMLLAILRYRTTAGLALLMPESGDFVVPWDDIEDASLNLASGEVRVTFREAYAAGAHWLRGARTLSGRWVDRVQLERAPE
jgi:hypothetical protein